MKPSLSLALLLLLLLPACVISTRRGTTGESVLVEELSVPESRVEILTLEHATAGEAARAILEAVDRPAGD